MQKNRTLIELGNFFKMKRESLSPEIYGLKVDSRRRVKGLKREEVATFSSVSLSLYTWLEQGWEVSVSTDTLERIAKTLKLTDAETKYIFLLTKQHTPLMASNKESKVDPIYRNILDSFLYYPAFIIDNNFNTLAWNKCAVILFGDYGLIPKKERNALRRMFLDPKMKECIENWEESAKRLISVFRIRMAYSQKDESDENKELLEELKQKSPEFNKWWSNKKVQDDTSDIKILKHPHIGRLLFYHTSFQSIDNNNIKLIIYVPEEDSFDTIKQFVEKETKQ
ncbi:MAG: hypothetical protein A2086_01600 [Spirochaetes bacterium GWD1_27_9]|nr:MAG: hypothetical protein A2Z98_08955 [Spirochaetes bacterium GWB1_27_13]OHD28054.1 MAG: hypothetical protein A2Y34_02610 [Spirochaetes bacterium GWC1_27_15]OHD41770.1 MAG: hypothetical protein A2086_01600 [Spirochaetes bacterium GWD1_27_9]